MKKSLIIISVTLISAMLFSSCKKDHVCSCTYKTLGINQTYEWTIKDATRKEAKAECEGYVSTGWTEHKCEIK